MGNQRGGGARKRMLDGVSVGWRVRRLISDSRDAQTLSGAACQKFESGLLCDVSRTHRRKRMEVGLFLLSEFLVRQVIAIAGLLVLGVLILS